MDKETLSHYGWIVVLVLIISVMLALASPLGMFIADGFKASYNGLFDVNSNAMDIAGIVTGGPSADPALNPSGTIPEGGKYTTTDGQIFEEGDKFPETVMPNDKYEDCDYIYTFKEEIDGWHVKAKLKTKETYQPIFESISDKLIKDMSQTFYQNKVMKVSPAVPYGVEIMYNTYGYCTSLTKAPAITNRVTTMEEMFFMCSSLKDVSALSIPNTVTNMELAFRACTSLETAPAIPESVTNLDETFNGCTNLSGIVVINASAKRYSHCFNLYENSDKHVILTGNSTILNQLLHTSNPIYRYRMDVRKTPGTVSDGDLTDIGDYEYKYQTEFNGWQAQANWYPCSYSQPEFGEIYKTIDGVPITNMDHAFQNYDGFKVSPEIPDTVTSMEMTFWGADSLEVAPKLPSALVNMDSTFGICGKLVTYAGAPAGTANGDFSGYEIPETVKNMELAFRSCTSLEKAPVIHKNVENINETFNGCTNLSGIVIINTSASKYNHCFGIDSKSDKHVILTGDSTILNQLLHTSNPTYRYRMDVRKTPGAVSNGDLTDIGDYEYKYQTEFNGWQAQANWYPCSYTQTTFGEIYKTIDNIPITNMDHAFQHYTGFKVAPEIPDTVTSMYMTFYGSSSLEVAPKLPRDLKVMEETFVSCNNLITYAGAPAGTANGDFSGYNIPYGVENMRRAFLNCGKIVIAPAIPNTVTNLSGTFNSCTSLTTAPTIPSSVVNMQRTFSGCTSLTGTIVINASNNVDCSYCFEITKPAKDIVLTGTCTKLNSFKYSSNTSYRTITVQ